ncbi:hypothetical protein GCM10023115_48520 [Pontixanthobacter gangjinensis]|uniref:Glycosyltransferase n=1 Tax=Christiangramia aestuarii TaxID=1028746 RepID=A0A7M3SWS7_9FLAO|nr:glycosyltransferase [Christiangramia aestuarii]MUP41058.1 glycosyltransferase [Christiangramia aestuarii]
MKILQLVTKRQYRGAEVFAANLSKELINFGHSIIFAGLYKNDCNILTVEGAQNLDLSEGKSSAISISLIKTMVKLVKDTNPDVIQCNGSDTLKYMVIANFYLKKRPIVYRNISTISEWLGSDLKLSLYKKIFSRVDHVTSVGSESIHDLIDTLGYPKEQTSVIRRGIPNEKLNGEDFGWELRKELGLGGESKIVMHVGNFSPEKNHTFLLEIFQELKSSHPEIKLVCVGDGVTYGDIDQKIKNNGLEESVFLLGFRKNIPELLSASDCIVLSSLVEGVPGVILEAAVQEKPTVASNVGGVKEVLIDKQTGFIIDNFDKDRFRNKIVGICENETLRKTLGTNARNLVVEQFNPNKNARKFEKLYFDLAGITPDQQGKLKILQIIQKKQYRGAEIFCAQLSTQLEEKGHEVKVCSIYDGTAKLPFHKEIESLERIQSFRYADYFGWKTIANIIREFKPDVVQANASDTLKYSIMSREIFGWQVPIVFRNASLTSYYVKGKLSKELNKFLFQKVDQVVSVSESSKRDLNELFPFTTTKTNVITNGVDNKMNIDFKNPYEESNINIVHVGSLTPEKNHHHLLEIHKLFLESHPTSILHIIGEGALKGEIEKSILKLGISDNVKLYGETPEPEAYIYYADMLVLPSLVEGLPGVVLEAMNYKTIVVAYNVGGISEVLDENTGFLVEPNNLKCFVESMKNALSGNNSKKISEAKNLVCTKFNNSFLADKFLQVYRDTISKRNKK